MSAAKLPIKLVPMILSLLLMASPTIAGEAAEPSPGPPIGPSIVQVERMGDGAFVYTVDGQPEFMVGMGYNPIYRFLSCEERAARYDDDFSRLRGAGITTILGWDADKGYEQDKFDRLTLDKAWEHGLGVVMPFYLPPEGDYEDPSFRARLEEALVAKVEAYKDHPALRMWGIGNEVIEGVIDRGQVEAFGQLYLDLADTVHEIDPNHPVIYREAEDVFLPYLTWYGLQDGVDRSWLLYGVNAYTFRLEEILDNWPSLGYDIPLFVTEFAPEGWGPADRPKGYLTMWQMIRAHPRFVLGGAPYVWTTEGPEPVDREFGLVDANGNPADGSLEALTGEFRVANLRPPILVRASVDEMLGGGNVCN